MTDKMAEPGGVGLDVATVAEWVKSWVVPFFGPGALVGLIWVGRKMQVMDSALEKLNKHEGELEVIKSKQIATDLRVAELPSRTEMTAIVQAAVSQIGQMIAVRYHKEPSFEDYELTMKRHLERYMGTLNQAHPDDIEGD
jgi:hypothetical protein